MKQLVVVFLVLLPTLSCARHFVVERDRGRMDGDKSITAVFQPQHIEKVAATHRVDLMQRRDRPLPIPPGVRKIVVPAVVDSAHRC